jgi:hypothetical protein
MGRTRAYLASPLGFAESTRVFMASLEAALREVVEVDNPWSFGGPELGAAFARAEAIGRGQAGTVRVGFTPAIGPATREEAARVLRDGAPELSVSFREVRPGQVPELLRDREVDVVLARTSRGAPDVDSAALRPSAVELFVPAGHRLAHTGAVRLEQLDGERLLTWSPPGTPYTDLLVRRLRAAGARVEPVESHVTGGGEPPDLTETGAVALMPAGWPTGAHNARVAIADDISLPLLVLWPTGMQPPAVRRLLAGMGTTAGRT